MSKGGGGGGVQESVVTQTNLPEYARPYYEDMLKRTVFESTRPYEAFPGQRLADFTDAERAGMQGFQEMAATGAPQQMRTATDIATQVGYQDIGSGMDIARSFSPEMQRSEYEASRIGSSYQAGDLGQGFQAGQRGVGYQAGRFDPGYEAGDLDQDYRARTLRSRFEASEVDPGYEASVRQSGFRPGTIADAETLEKYMNPYQQLVTDIEKREARKQSEIQGSAIEQQAAQAGGLGGYREAIMQSEREKNLAEQLQDIQARGGQAAFEQAQKAFEADRAARIQQETFKQGAFQAGEQAKQRAAELGLTAQQQEQAGQQAQEKFRQDAFAQTEQGRALEQKLNQAAFEAGEQARQRAAELGLNAQQQEDAARQAQERFSQEQFAQNEQLRLAQQQEERAVFEARQRAEQEAARLGLSAAEIQERALQAENEARMRARQENAALEETRARLGFAGLDADRATQAQRLEAAGLLGRLGTDEQRMAIERLRNLQASGQIERELSQRGLDIGYQDFLRQQAFPREQLAFFSQLLQGLPVTPGSQTTTFGGPSQTERILGTGIGGVGLYNAMR